MTGYRIVFDRDNMNLGWKESNCEYNFAFLSIKNLAYTLFLTLHFKQWDYGLLLRYWWSALQYITY